MVSGKVSGLIEAIKVIIPGKWGKELFEYAIKKCYRKLASAIVYASLKNPDALSELEKKPYDGEERELWELVGGEVVTTIRKKTYDIVIFRDGILIYYYGEGGPAGALISAVATIEAKDINPSEVDIVTLLKEVEAVVKGSEALVKLTSAGIQSDNSDDGNDDSEDDESVDDEEGDEEGDKC